MTKLLLIYKKLTRCTLPPLNIRDHAQALHWAPDTYFRQKAKSPPRPPADIRGGPCSMHASAPPLAFAAPLASAPPLASAALAAAPLAFAATPRSRFDAALLGRHLAEAAEFVARCQRAGQPVLDPCGPRGDLYFLLKAALEPASRHTRPAARPTGHEAWSVGSSAPAR
jgi:hypothetical protein